jgi:hypothetical protein
MEVQAQEASEDYGLTKTKYGIPIDYDFSKPASEERIKRVSESLVQNNIEVHVVDTASDARALLEKLLPLDKEIFTSSSETVRLSGIDQLINGPNSQFRSVRKELAKLDPATQFRQQVKLGATPDVVVGSVHAVTESGQVLVASASGSQIAPYVAGAEKVFWVVGSQKLVKDLKAGLRRIELYSYPMEDARMHEVRNFPSMLAKVLIVYREPRPGRTAMVLVREPIGF